MEGITEWLPVSSTGHMILVEEFLKFQDEQFSQMFLVVVQLGAILAVVLFILEQDMAIPFYKERGANPLLTGRLCRCGLRLSWHVFRRQIVGILFDDWIDEVFYNAYVVACALIVYGIFYYYCRELE